MASRICRARPGRSLLIAVTLVLVLGNFLWMCKLQAQAPRSGLHLPRWLPTAAASGSVGGGGGGNAEATGRGRHGAAGRDGPDEIAIAAVVCGDRVNETLVMMKSALALSGRAGTAIQFIVFADEPSAAALAERVGRWPAPVRARMRLDLHPIALPAGDKADEWRRLFKPCASQRLFLPSLLLDVDALLYMDTDTVFLSSPVDVWRHFGVMNATQMAAVAPEHEDYATGWYNRFARHPYYGNLGVNSGVMLMNLTRMRHFGWEQYVIPIYQEYKTKITWGDQDIINIVFHFHPERLYVYPCHFNYRPDHCMYMSVCKSAEERGVHVLHGNRGSFHSDKQPAFLAVYDAIDRYEFGSDLETRLHAPMKAALVATASASTNCGKMAGALLKALERQLSEWSAADGGRAVQGRP